MPSVKGKVNTVWPDKKKTKIKITNLQGQATEYFVLEKTENVANYDAIIAAAFTALTSEHRVQLFYDANKNVTSLAVFSTRIV